jgi:hypothetical protein
MELTRENLCTEPNPTSGRYVYNTLGEGVLKQALATLTNPNPNLTLTSGRYVYNTLGEGVLKQALAGFNACVFAYGQTVRLLFPPCTCSSRAGGIGPQGIRTRTREGAGMRAVQCQHLSVARLPYPPLLLL